MNSARRKLLKSVVYVPPMILGSMVVTPRTVMGDGGIGTIKTCKTKNGKISIVISSGTNVCCPCVTTSTEFDAKKCAITRCVKSCGTNCAPGVIQTIDCDKFCKYCGTVPTNCEGNCNCRSQKGKNVCK